MKAKTFSGIAAVAVSALLAGAATAQTANPPAPGRGPTPAARHAVVDVDRDGRISQAEFVQARTARLAALDTDRDGSVTAAELRAGMQARRTERANLRFERLDADKNGQISRAEFDAARAQGGEKLRAARSERAGHRTGHGRADRMGARRGGAQPMAQGARGPIVIAEVQARAAATFARLDTDHDGFLNASEALRARGDRVGQAPGARGHQARRMAHPGARHMARPTARPMTPASPSAPTSE